MGVPIQVNVRVTGGLFKRNISQVSRDALVGEVFTKLDARYKRGGKGIGSQRNAIGSSIGGIEMGVSTTRNYPRTKGTSWQRKNIGITRSMAPRALRKYAERLVAEVSRG